MNNQVKSLLKVLFENRQGDYVFIRTNGKPIAVQHIYRTFTQAQCRAKLERHFRFHDLRHTFASHFMMNGGNLYDLQKILGHSNIEMTMRYAHLTPDHLVEAINIVNFGAENDNVEQLFGRQNENG